MEKLISFHGKQELKEHYVARVKDHAAKDELIKGTGWIGGKGCAIGCTYHTYDHFAGEVQMGVPYAISIFEDRIFEDLPNEEAMTWPLEFIEAVPVGVNLDKVATEFQLWVLNDEKEGLIHRETNPKRLDVLNRLIELDTISLTSEVTEDQMKDLANLADRAYLAYRSDRHASANLANLADRAYLANLADRENLSGRADRENLARKMRVKLIQMLKSTTVETKNEAI